jgi:uncharacterized protein (TIGR02996 family)
MSPAPAPLEQAFLDDIVANPEDPSLWLILVDWLTEREDPRAELVRLSWCLRHERDHPEFLTRQARVQELLLGGMLPVVPRRTFGGFEFAWIPPGSFLLGSPEDEEEHQTGEELRPVTIASGFWFGVYQVTQSQYQAMVGSNPSTFARDGDSSTQVRNVPSDDLDRYPVEHVSWEDATAFCKKLSRRFHRKFRLPSEAQWQYACRAGTTTPFFFGSVLNGTQANVDGNYPYGTSEKGPYLRHPCPVGTYPPNAFGLYDMHGNVWEWCQDLYDLDVDNSDGARLVKGGSWDSYNRNARAAYRNDFLPTTRNNVVGFRLVVLA